MHVLHAVLHGAGWILLLAFAVIALVGLAAIVLTRSVRGWLVWTVFQLVSLVLTIIGWPLLLPLAFLEAWAPRPSKSSIFAGRNVNAWVGGWLTWIWCNEEDGVTGAPWYTLRYRTRSEKINAYLWSAWRNSANNLRFLPGMSFLTVKAQLVVSRGATFTTITQGWRQCLILGPPAAPWLRIGWLMHETDGDGWRAWPVLEPRPGPV